MIKELTLDFCKKVCEDKEEFVCIDKGDYFVFDYVLEKSDTFISRNGDYLSPSLLNMRGVAFDKSGKLCRIPLQKFFNINQNKFSMVNCIDWSKPHTVMDKLDGSLIYPVYLEDRIIFGTRKVSDDFISMVDIFLNDNQDIRYNDFTLKMRELNFTPFFEFFCQDNMIVIDYGSPMMTLLAARHLNSGEYLDQCELKKIADEYNVPIVETFDVDLSYPNNFLSYAKEEKEKEGYIIRFEDGYTVKVKNDWYVQLHHTISGLNTNRNIARLLLDNDIDDILPILPDKRRESVEIFSEQFWNFYNEFKLKIEKSWNDIKSDSNSNWSRKDWAMRIQEEDKYYMGLMFKFLDADGDLDRDKSIRDFIYSKMNKESIFDDFCKYAGFNL